VIIKSLRVRNFRCVMDETLHCDDLTVLVGANGSGKSSFLRALDIFYDPNAKYTEDDFHARDTNHPILITVTFTQLTDRERGLFRKYIEGEEMTVEKELRWSVERPSQQYFGTSLRNPEFEPFRSAAGTGLRQEYDRLRGIDRYSSFPPYTNREEAGKTLEEWEQANPNLCSRQRVGGQFFGFKEVGEADLERHTRFLLIPAVRDASEDAIEGRGAAMSEIMELVVRRALQAREDVVKFREQTEKRYKKVFDPSKVQELQMLQNSLTEILQAYVPESRVDLSWQEETGFEIPMPTASVRLVEDEYASPVGYAGHGLQRAFILTMLQYLAVSQPSVQVQEGDVETQASTPNLIVGIEEPELYQHPNRQRHLSNVLMTLATKGIAGVASQAQIVYSTHSPLFVDLERFEQVRVFRKEEQGGEPRQTRVFRTTLEDVAKHVERGDGKPAGTYTREGIRERLRACMTLWLNEGFFADLVVLVEGQKDWAMIVGAAEATGVDLVARGISVIPCGGKDCLIRPAAVFKSMNIPVYVIWDSDREKTGAQPEDNRRFLRFFGHPVEDWPRLLTDDFACFETNLMNSFVGEIGEPEFNQSVDDACRAFGIPDDRGNPRVIREVVEQVIRKGIASPTLTALIQRLVSEQAGRRKLP